MAQAPAQFPVETTLELRASQRPRNKKGPWQVATRDKKKRSGSTSVAPSPPERPDRHHPRAPPPPGTAEKKKQTKENLLRIGRACMNAGGHRRGHQRGNRTTDTSSVVIVEWNHPFYQLRNSRREVYFGTQEHYCRETNDSEFKVKTRSMVNLWAERNPLNHKTTDFGLTNPPSALETLRTSGVLQGPGAS